MQTNPLSWNKKVRSGSCQWTKTTQWDTLLLSGKERWERLSADNMTNKSQADANRDFIWITSGFSVGIWPKLNWWAASQSQASVAAQQYQLKMIHLSLFFAFLFPALTLISSAPSAYFDAARPFSSLLSCGRKFSQLPSKVSLHRRRQRGLAWLSLNAQLQWEFVSN